MEIAESFINFILEIFKSARTLRLIWIILYVKSTHYYRTIRDYFLSKLIYSKKIKQLHQFSSLDDLDQD